LSEHHTLINSAVCHEAKAKLKNKLLKTQLKLVDKKCERFYSHTSFISFAFSNANCKLNAKKKLNNTDAFSFACA
jgi:hypothetical protein